MFSVRRVGWLKRSEWMDREWGVRGGCKWLSWERGRWLTAVIIEIFGIWGSLMGIFSMVQM